MSYISKIFERLDIGWIVEYLLHGAEGNKLDRRSYRERLESKRDAAYKILHGVFPTEAEYETKAAIVLDYAFECENVYMEIGLQCGIALGMQIMGNLNGNK